MNLFRKINVRCLEKGSTLVKKQDMTTVFLPLLLVLCVQAAPASETRSPSWSLDAGDPWSPRASHSMHTHTHTHRPPHTQTHTQMHTRSMQTHTQNIQLHKPTHAHNYKSLHVHTNACVRTHGHPSKYARTRSYTKSHIHVIMPTKHTCTLMQTRMHKSMPPTHVHQTHTLTFSLSLPLCPPGWAGAPGVPSGGWEGSTCGRKGSLSVYVSQIGSLSARRVLLGHLLHWLSAGHRRAPLPTAGFLPAWSPSFLSAPQAVSLGLGNLFTAAGDQEAEGPSWDICLSASWASVSQAVNQRGGFWGYPTSCTALSLPAFCTKSPSPRRG